MAPLQADDMRGTVFSPILIHQIPVYPWSSTQQFSLAEHCVYHYLLS